MDTLNFEGWYSVEFTTSISVVIKIDRAIRDINGYVMYLVDQDGRYYNFSNIKSFRKESING